ncbi:MAG: hypothetical protein ACREEB_00855 [Caulobacteraceae bacterium]
MRNTLILVAIAALAFTSVADAKTAPAKGMTAQPTRCHNAKGHVIKCPTAASTAAPAAPAATGMATGRRTHKPAVTAAAPGVGGPHCTKGKPCGKSCIAMDKVCHK